MQKQEIVFTTFVAKKHSVRYSTKEKEAVISDVYIKNSAFGNKATLPKQIKVTIEEID